MLLIKKNKNSDTFDPANAPIPPRELMEYSEGKDEHLGHGKDAYDKMKAACLSAGVDITTGRVLDFGANNGRVTRWHENTNKREIWGCDIQADKIFWAIENLSPPFRFFVNSAATAHLPFKDGYFDFICAHSIFTHLMENHIAWLLELLRVLSPNGTLFFSATDETQMGLPHVSEFRKQYFTAFANGELRDADYRYAAMNMYSGGALAHVYMDSSYIKSMLPKGYTIAARVPQAMRSQTGYVIRPER